MNTILPHGSRGFLDPSSPSSSDQIQALRTAAEFNFEILWKAEVSTDGEKATITCLDGCEIPPHVLCSDMPTTIQRQSWLKQIHEDDRERVDNAACHSLATGEDFLVVFRVQHSNGSFKWWEIFATLAGWVHGRPLRWVGAARDVTSRVLSENAHRNLVDQLHEIGGQIVQKEIGKRAMAACYDEEEIVGQSPAIREVLQKIPHVAPTNSTVLITGETGTGKELFARAIHCNSRRRDKPMIAVNCAALPASLVKSELFGHEKGAFTGAWSRHIGRFELAHRGTIFLDEVEDLQPETQAKLLRVLQTGEFQRIGSNETRRVDVRVIAASNRNLQEMAEAGSFRRDLFFRLNVFPVHLPPLRERKEDIPLLAAFLIQKKGQDLGRRIEQIPADCLAQLKQYNWPGNVRELENVIERALILCSGPVFDLDGLALSLQAEKALPGAPPAVLAPMDNDRGQRMEEIERAHIIRVCQDCSWHIKGRKGAAERLGLHPSTLYFRMRKLGIMRPERIAVNNVK